MKNLNKLFIIFELVFIASVFAVVIQNGIEYTMPKRYSPEAVNIKPRIYFTVDSTAPEKVSKESMNKAGSIAAVLASDLTHMTDSVLPVMVQGDDTEITAALASLSKIDNLCNTDFFKRSVSAQACEVPKRIQVVDSALKGSAVVYTSTDSVININGILSVSLNGTAKNAMLVFKRNRGPKKHIVINDTLMKNYGLFMDPTVIIRK